MEQKRLLSVLVTVIVLFDVSVAVFGDKIKLSERDDGETVIARVGDEIVLRLSGNPTTGYQWMLDDIAGNSVVPDGIIEYESIDSDKRVGAGGFFIARFNPVKTGRTVFKLVYIRPWEKNKKPAEVFLVTLDVKKAISRPVKEVEAKYLTHSHGKMEGEVVAGTGQGVIFETPQGNQKLIAIQIYASRHGTPKAPDENFHVYLLDAEGKKTIASFKYPYSDIQRGTMKWYLLQISPTRVPQKFLVVLAFNPMQNKSIHLGYTKADAATHSRFGLPGQSFSAVNKPIEWMVRAFFEVPDATEIPPEPVKKAKRINAKLPLTAVETDSEISRKLTAEGWKLWKQNKFFDAEKLFSQALEKDPKNADAWSGLGRSKLNQGKRFEARFDFNKCLALDPQNSAALNGLGWIANDEGKTDDAIAFWKRAIASAPDATAALNGLASTFMEQKNYKQAIQYYQMWLKVEPNNETAKAGLKKAQEAKKQ